ncbi:MAG TPA: formate dehydrogenase accessory sulfurtransferase FdhD, partial [Ktedonobacteraceae bacterium]|nr:formate dehydrogenase accessory sulfurtransferase FdhD [Ktedonobacteraceae bacterium]
MTLTDYWRSALDPERVMQARVTHWQDHEQRQREDALTVEEPFEVRINSRSVAMIMRTPGHDFELALGFLFSEGIIQNADEVLTIKDAADTDGLPLANVVDVVLRSQGPQERAVAFERHFAVSASCGLCGKNSIADLMLCTPPLEPNRLCIPAKVLYELDAHLRSAQTIFSHTGGLHAAGLFSKHG